MFSTKRDYYLLIILNTHIINSYENINYFIRLQHIVVINFEYVYTIVKCCVRYTISKRYE